MARIIFLFLSFLSFVPASKVNLESNELPSHKRFNFFPEVKYDLYILSYALSPSEQIDFFKAVRMVEHRFADHLYQQEIPTYFVKSLWFKKPLGRIADRWIDSLTCFLPGVNLKGNLRSIILYQINEPKYISLPHLEKSLNNADISRFSDTAVITSLLARHIVEGVNFLRMTRYKLLNPENDTFIPENIADYTLIHNRVNTTSRLCLYSPHFLFFEVKKSYLATISPSSVLEYWVNNIVRNRLTILYTKFGIPFNPKDFFQVGYAWEKLRVLFKANYPEKRIPNVFTSINPISRPPFKEFKNSIDFLTSLIESNLENSTITLVEYEFMLLLWKVLTDVSIIYYHVLDPCEVEHDTSLNGYLLPPSSKSCILRILQAENLVVLYK